MFHKLAALVTLLLGLLLAPALASTVVKLDFGQLSRSAAAIIAGEIVGIQAERSAEGYIISTIEMSVDRAVPQYLTKRQYRLRMIGGEFGGQRQYISGMPRFRPGDRCVLFLDGSQAARLAPTMGLWQGVFFVEEIAGRKAILDSERRPVTAVDEDRLIRGLPVSKDSARQFHGSIKRPLDLEEFFAEIVSRR